MTKIENEIESIMLERSDFNLSSLLQTKKSLTQRTANLEANVQYIADYDRRKWQKASSDDQIHVLEIVYELQKDFEGLLDFAITLIKRCNEAMSLIQAVTTLRQTDRAVEESRSLKNLTLLAFFFVPLGFTTSVFGMNFKEFSSQNSVTIGFWLAVAIPVTLIAMSPFYADIKASAERIWENSFPRSRKRVEDDV